MSEIVLAGMRTAATWPINGASILSERLTPATTRTRKPI
jgi:hypothetical protein